MGDMFGKNEAEAPAADAQARIAQQLFSQTDPLRRGLIERSTDFIGAPTTIPARGAIGAKEGTGGGAIGGALNEALAQLPNVPIAGGTGGTPTAGSDQFVRGSPTYLAYKDSADRNFGRAKDNVIARLPAGGALTDSLVNLEGQRAEDLTQAAGNIYENELARAISLATGTTGQSLTSFGQAGNTQAMLAQANAETSAGKSGALGSGLGTMIGLKAA